MAPEPATPASPVPLEQCLRNLSLLLSPDNDLAYYPSPSGGGRRAVASVSLGQRPWVEALVLPRLQDFAQRVGADLIVVRGEAAQRMRHPGRLTRGPPEMAGHAIKG